jgi:hypothetical protein
MFLPVVLLRPSLSPLPRSTCSIGTSPPLLLSSLLYSAVARPLISVHGRSRKKDDRTANNHILAALSSLSCALDTALYPGRTSRTFSRHQSYIYRHTLTHPHTPAQVCVSHTSRSLTHRHRVSTSTKLQRMRASSLASPSLILQHVALASARTAPPASFEVGRHSRQFRSRGARNHKRASIEMNSQCPGGGGQRVG